ncbi:MAG TPA: methionyl-tRNA formyltransferase [Candidatus Baltobacteraceae bacterium]|nr:methionyl-tRNA formyltransferase [Candidatus Baltobacteraceae bacterium]
MRALFFGTSAFAVPSLRVAAGKTELAGVVTQPDRPAGRGQRLQPTPVKSAALELGLHVFEPVRLRAFAAEIAAASLDLLVLASYGRILPAELLALPRLGALNVHPSLLPKYRGATPIQTAIARGERETGVSIMLMDAGLDTGDVVLAERTAIAPDETYGELHDRLAVLGADLLGRAIDLAAHGVLTARAQTGEAILTRPILKTDLAIDWAWPAQRIVDHVRAYSPQPAARAEIEGETVKVLRAHVAADGTAAVDEVVAPNRGKMSGREYRRMRSGRR